MSDQFHYNAPFQCHKNINFDHIVTCTSVTIDGGYLYQKDEQALPGNLEKPEIQFLAPLPPQM
jgi:hypothetical protein